jgi:hypothetical protein
MAWLLLLRGLMDGEECADADTAFKDQKWGEDQL